MTIEESPGSIYKNDAVLVKRIPSKMSLKEKIIKHLLNEKGNIVSSRSTEKYLRKVGIWDDLAKLDFFDNGIQIRTAVNAVLNDIYHTPKCLQCDNLCKETWKSEPGVVFNSYCSLKCMANDPKVIEKRISNTDYAKAKIRRSETMIKKFGYEYNALRPEVKESLSKKTTNRFLSKEIQEKLTDREWMIEQYVTQEKTALQISNELGVYYGTVLSYLDSHNVQIRQQGGRSYLEKTVYDFVKSLRVDPDISFSSKKILESKREIDIILPNKKVAIEVNGLFWHSSTNTANRNYHLEKTEEAEQQGWMLFHIFEDEWNNKRKREIWESILRVKLGAADKKIYARKCIVKEISVSIARDFFDNNHLMGFRGGNHLGLFYNDELVMGITYSGSELVRVCSLKNVVVIGGLSKLLKRMPKGNYFTYADRRHSFAGGYGNLFNLIGKTSPNYWWWKGNSNAKIPRYATQKNKLPKLLGNLFDPNKTEFENMFSAGYRIIFDSGSYKYSFQIG